MTYLGSLTGSDNIPLYLKFFCLCEQKKRHTRLSVNTSLSTNKSRSCQSQGSERRWEQAEGVLPLFECMGLCKVRVPGYDSYQIRCLNVNASKKIQQSCWALERCVSDNWLKTSANVRRCWGWGLSRAKNQYLKQSLIQQNSHRALASAAEFGRWIVPQ